MLRTAIVCVVLAATATAAEAGACLSEDEILDGVKFLEKRAKDPKAEADPPYIANCVRQVPENYPKHGKRVSAVCEKILTREPKDELCIDLSVQLGHKQWGGVDLFEAVSSRKIVPWNWDVDMTVRLLGKLGDPRAAPLLVAAWKGHLEEAARREKKKWRGSITAWAGWRQDAARALGAVGGAEDKAFLEEQANATKDKFVRQACTDAMAAIDKRLAAKPAAPAPAAPAPAVPAPAKP